MIFFFRNSNSSLKDEVIPIKDESDSKVSRQFNFLFWAVLTILSKFEVGNYRTAMEM